MLRPISRSTFSRSPFSRSTIIPLFLLLGGVLALPAAARASDSSSRELAISAASLTRSDAIFVYDTLLCSSAVVKASELALKRDLTGQEREFAQQMVDQHAALDDELKAIAKAKGVAVPTVPDEKRQKQLDALEREHGRGFAKAYLAYQVDAHQEAVSAFKAAGKGTKDADVQAFIAKHLPALEQHLEAAKTLAKNS